MEKRKNLLMIGAFLAIVLLFAIALIKNNRFNSNEQTLEFNKGILKEGGVSDNNISVRISPRGYQTNDLSSWYHTYKAENFRGKLTDHTAVGTIYELVITNLSSDVISDWSAKIAMPMKTHFNSGWNGNFEIHQNTAENEKVFEFNNVKTNVDDIELDYIYDQNVLLIPMEKGDYFIYKPSETSNEVPLTESKPDKGIYTDKIIGFIVYTPGITPDFAISFYNGSISYKLHRKLTQEVIFWVACVCTFVWLVFAVAFLIVAYKMKKIEKERKANEELIHKFETDDLTKTFTRQAFFHYSELKLKNSDKQYGAMLVSIDNFKITHSKYGETICNEFLCYLADYLMKIFPNGHVGRFSRSRYSVFFEMENDKDYHVDDILNEEMLKASPMPNQVLKLGIYAPIDPNATIRRCYDRASLALSKIQGIYGQNVAFYDDSMESKLLDDHKIEEYMEQALSEKQFCVYYQPKHSTSNKDVVGAEALVRWHYPQYGFMSPAQFIPIFERTGFITKLDAYVFETVCHDLKDWQEKGFAKIPVSINVSRKDFYEDDWINKRLEFLDKVGTDTSLIHVEVTESAYAEDTDVIKAKLELLQDKGIKIEMDDFGSGYSSLGMLAGMSLDVLKLDISFVKDIESSEVVVASIISLAHQLGLSVVSEGVETELQYQTMKKHGCDFIQGYYFAKPMTKDEFEKYIG